MPNTFNSDQKGQALVFVIATMTVAMAIGVGVSLRNLSSISRTSRTDTSARAQAAAEGGAENVLSRRQSQIEAMVGRPAEIITFTPATGDNVTAVAEVTVTRFNIPSGYDYLPLEISEGQVTEVVLDGNSVDVCWSGSGDDADIYYVAYNEDGDTVRKGVSGGAGHDSNFEGSDAGDRGFDHCYNDVDTPSDAVGLRIRALGADISAGVVPSSGSLADQGYLITSIGRLGSVEAGDKAEAVVEVVRSNAYAPGIFDFGIYSGSSGDALD